MAPHLQARHCRQLLRLEARVHACRGMTHKEVAEGQGNMNKYSKWRKGWALELSQAARHGQPGAYGLHRVAVGVGGFSGRRQG